MQRGAAALLCLAACGAGCRPFPPPPLARMGEATLDGPPRRSDAPLPAPAVGGGPGSARDPGEPAAPASFPAALRDYERHVIALDLLPADLRVESLPRTIERLATVVAMAPRGDAAGQRRASVQIRADALALAAPPPGIAATPRAAKHALGTAASSLRALADGPFARAPLVRAMVDGLDEAIAGIGERGPLAAELSGIIVALRAAAAVLETVDGAWHDLAREGR